MYWWCGVFADEEPVGAYRHDVAGKTAPAALDALALAIGGDSLERLAVERETLLLVSLDLVIRRAIEHGKQRFGRFRKLADVVSFRFQAFEHFINAFRNVEQSGAGLLAHARRIVVHDERNLLLLVGKSAQV